MRTKILSAALICAALACGSSKAPKTSNISGDKSSQALDTSTEVGAYYADVEEALCLRSQACCEADVYGVGQDFDVARCKAVLAGNDSWVGTLAFAAANPTATVSDVGRDACLAGIATAACGSLNTTDWAPMMAACRAAIEVPPPDVSGGDPCSEPGGYDTCGTFRGTNLRCDGTECVPRGELGDECVWNWDCKSELCDWNPNTVDGLPTLCSTTVAEAFNDPYTCNYYVE